MKGNSVQESDSKMYPPSVSSSTGKMSDALLMLDFNLVILMEVLTTFVGFALNFVVIHGDTSKDHLHIAIIGLSFFIELCQF